MQLQIQFFVGYIRISLVDQRYFVAVTSHEDMEFPPRSSFAMQENIAAYLQGMEDWCGRWIAKLIYNSTSYRVYDRYVNYMSTISFMI